ncbi:MAG: potassium channel family protein [Colwellia sp.]|nr:potassium channel family protein [Colwellia sp.]
MINLKNILLITFSLPALGIWFSWYFEKWDYMILCLLLTVPILIIQSYMKESVIKRSIDFCFHLSIYIPLIIYAFARLYEEKGLILNGEVVHSFDSSLYFSIVTWTTLGYGDFQATEAVRLWAATEAMFGYIFMALLIASFMSLLVHEKKAGKN